MEFLNSEIIGEYTKKSKLKKFKEEVFLRNNLKEQVVNLGIALFLYKEKIIDEDKFMKIKQEIIGGINE